MSLPWWWRRLWFHRAWRGARDAFYDWHQHVHPSLRHLPEHEQRWATHCFGCSRWLQSWDGYLSQPDEEACQVLGYLHVPFGSVMRYLCCRCTMVYHQGQRAGKEKIPA